MGDRRGGGAGRGAIQMLAAGGNPPPSAGRISHSGPPPPPPPPKPACDNQRLTQRVSVPGGSSARLERDTGARHARRCRSLEQTINAHRADKPIGRPFFGWLRADSLNFHIQFLSSFQTKS